MSSRILAHSVLLPRLVAAIGAGSLLAAPGCGSKSSDGSAGEVANQIGGEQNSSQSGKTDTSTDKTSQDHTSTSGRSSDRTSGNTTNYIESTNQDTRPISTTSTTSTTLETTAVPTDDPGATSEQWLESTMPEPEDASSPDAGLDASSTSEPPAQCEFGQAEQFCVNADQMEDQARWGVGDIARSEPLRDDTEIASGWDDNGCMKYEWIADGCCNGALGAGEAQGDGTCCYVACAGACCGRPFVVNGATVVAAVVSTRDWLTLTTPATLETAESFAPAARESLAAAWLEDARMEHASIASFSQFALDLLRLGAPPELVRDCHLAGLDEIEHARVGFAIASKLAGKNLGPGNLDVGDIHTHSLKEALTAAINEGCIGETLAAGIVAEQARRCSNPNIAEELAKIADDELRHSELAWRFVAWALTRYGAAARVTVEGAFARALARPPEAPTDLDLPVDVLHRAGRLSVEEWEATARDVMREVIEPAVAELCVPKLPRPERLQHDRA
jgi:hypothetical protein